MKKINESITMKIMINEFMDIVIGNDSNVPKIYVAGKPFKKCMFLVTCLPVNEYEGINSIDELASIPSARNLEGKEINMEKEQVLQAHASNLIAWCENDYDTRILHSNLSFPLLIELAKNGDEKAKKVLKPEIESRIKSKNISTIIAIIEILKRNQNENLLNKKCIEIMFERNVNEIDDFLVSMTSNKNLSSETIESLLEISFLLNYKNGEEMRTNLALNPSSSISILKKLTIDDCTEVKNLALEMIKKRIFEKGKKRN